MKTLFILRLIIWSSGFAANALTAHAQVQTAEVDVKGPPEEYLINGNIYPQFWKAKLSSQIAFVPLEKIVSIGVQDYEIVGGGHVHELSIAMEGHVMMRIYAIEAPTIVQRAKQKTNPTENGVTKSTGIAVPAVTHLQTDSVVKHYPATTHQPMMEFRVKKRESIDELFADLENAYLNYKMREVVKEQRKNAVQTTEKE